MILHQFMILYYEYITGTHFFFQIQEHSDTWIAPSYGTICWLSLRTPSTQFYDNSAIKSTFIINW